MGEMGGKERGIELWSHIGANYGMGNNPGFVEQIRRSVKETSGGERVAVMVVGLRRGMKSCQRAEPPAPSLHHLYVALSLSL